MADIFEIAGRIHSTSQEKVAVTADEVLDGTKKQSQINTETYGHVESIDNALANLSPEQQEALGVAAKANNNEANLGFYICDTAAGTAAKAITSANYVLTVGGSIKIKFEHANSAASGVTLKVGSAMAKPLYYDGTAVSVNNTWEDNETVEVYYDGTNYYANNVAGGGGDGVFDVSEKYPTSGVEGGNTYTLDGALAVLNANLPASKKKGGMSIKFVQSSDNKYIQARCMAQNFTDDVTQWQGVDDEPTAGSNNLVKSGGVEKYLAKEVIKVDNPDTETGSMSTSGVVNSEATSYRIVRPIALNPGETFVVNQGDSTYIGSGLALLYKTDSVGNWLENIITQVTAGGNTISNAKYTNESDSVIYVGTCTYTASVKYSIEKRVKAASFDGVLIGWILSESFLPVNATYTEGYIDSPINVKWPDGVSGTLTLTRNTDMEITSIVATHDNDSFTCTITRDSDDNVLDITIN